eukprot:CAMPEP_0203995498 /NCGR_PEP_ID=MMETSP0360-20130528/12111_1 /ASSEMBLY_ACC=CAM_ASM_000342 /TAXON_ID=268821 /ORGANISM="Scrippsiella Hangoei, Strain SHTV-5" /LENGTH=56 /DNA_ID=CAMNT_0050936203 /DNA_START=80 /DNA_END=246 /DNA_ORIENTATION=-
MAGGGFDLMRILCSSSSATGSMTTRIAASLLCAASSGKRTTVTEASNADPNLLRNS